MGRRVCSTLLAGAAIVSWAPPALALPFLFVFPIPRSSADPDKVGATLPQRQLAMCAAYHQNVIDPEMSGKREDSFHGAVIRSAVESLSGLREHKKLIGAYIGQWRLQSKQSYDAGQAYARMLIAGCDAAGLPVRAAQYDASSHTGRRPTPTPSAGATQQAAIPAIELVERLKAERLNKAIGRAVADGRCVDAKAIALREGRMDLAEQAVRLCQRGEPPPHNRLVIAVDRGTWVVPGDYPLAALSERRQGVTTVTFDVNEVGLPENCAVAGSSGHADLDQMACLAVTTRAFFVPATDVRGAPMKVRASERINWVLPAKP